MEIDNETLIEYVRQRRYGLSSYSVYHAVCWVEGKSVAEIQEEIKRVENTSHRYKWDQVGSAHLDYSRVEALKEILTYRLTNR